MTDHWGDFDFDDHHDVPDADHHDLGHQELGHQELGHEDLGHLDLGSELPDADHHDLGAEVHDELPVEDHAEIDASDISDISDVSESPDDLFPPTLDLGELPEPVDGFPWIDTATLGAADHAGFTPPLDPVTPDELAAYAHTGEPADWSTLAESDDPATSALARWWTPDEQ